MDGAMGYSNGMWRACVDGVHFCGQTKQALLTALNHGRPGVVDNGAAPAPLPLDPAEELASILRTGVSLEARQEARRRLLLMVADPAAIKYVEQLKQKPESSFYARDLCRRLGKSDFSDVTHMELVENVDNIVHRNQLILELSARTSL